MLKAALVGAIALATVGSSLALADDGDMGQTRAVVQSGYSLTHAQIARFRSVLKLTAAQEQYWPAVEHAFREMVAQQAQDDSAQQGFAQRIGNRAISVGVSAVSLRRLAAAAYPLLQSLDEVQKQNALALARSMGLESVASAF
jgi:hypothetical protein